jgi:hypothetical protein
MRPCTPLFNPFNARLPDSGRRHESEACALERGHQLGAVLIIIVVNARGCIQSADPSGRCKRLQPQRDDPRSDLASDRGQCANRAHWAERIGKNDPSAYCDGTRGPNTRPRHLERHRKVATLTAGDRVSTSSDAPAQRDWQSKLNYALRMAQVPRRAERIKELLSLVGLAGLDYRPAWAPRPKLRHISLMGTEQRLRARARNR